MEILDELESGMNNAGETPHDAPIDAPVSDENLPENIRLIDNPAEPSMGSENLKSGFELVADLLPMTEHKALGQWVMKYKINEDDPVFGNYLAGSVSFKSAEVAQKAAELVVNGINSIPKIMQDAVFKGSTELSSGIKHALVINSKVLSEGIKTGVNAGTNDAIEVIKKTTETATAKIGNSVNSLTKAIDKIDTEMNNEIIARRDSVIANWVDKGSDELNRRINEAIKKERNINLGFMLFVIFSTFIFGIAIGYVVSTHVSF